ncbi:ADP-ribosylation factor-like protein 6-interacting protein 6 [Mastacembelus armatus]|uniref:ADP-ribosylation factor-like 6 interacting protein 6 n=1 Tax=Mastacembelus armatus TaxID=205130 RepID=A0A3Q3L7Y6_9TELE|nr:ADP-ribosylation factor-like protein 6-interacting protein 6 [Mastacembelus armatus]
MKMPRSVTDRDVLRESFDGSYSPEDTERPETGGLTGPAFSNRSGSKPWSVVALSVLGSVLAVAAVGCFCALIYPILKELRAETVRGEDGTQVKILGFWSILVLSVFVGCICCAFSWTLAYFDSYQPGMVFPTPLALAHLRDVSGHGFHLGYGVAILNGIMATLAVIWSLI